MALPDLVTPPLHIAEERAWRQGREVAPSLTKFKTVIQQTGVDFAQLERYFNLLIELRARLVALIDSGEIDTATTWKANLVTARNSLNSLGPIYQAGMRKYGEIAANLKATTNAAGGDMTYAEAQAVTPIEAVDVATIVAAVDAILD